MPKLAQFAGVIALACLFAILIADVGPPWSF
jgi:hypothetical protein